MPVAKSYKDLPRLCEPFEANGKMYVKVQTKSGSEKLIRWYTEQEYKRMYPDEIIENKRVRSVKDVLGFEKGYITIFKGNTYENLEYFRSSSARYNKFWGWYFISTDEVPSDLPTNIEPIQLKWEDVSDGENLIPEKELKMVIESLIYDPTDSEFIGTIGQRIEDYLTITKVIPFENYYGHSYMHIMVDKNSNEFVWTTATKNLTIGETYQIRGTIKGHKIYRNSKQTILSHCVVK